MTTHVQPRSRQEAAAILGVSTRTIDRLIARGEMPAIRAGRRVLVLVDQFITERASATGGEVTP